MTAILPKFTVRQRVRVKVGQATGNIDTGKVYRIESISEDYVQVRDDKGDLDWYFASRFEPAPSDSPKAKAGTRQIDKVRAYVAGAVNLTLAQIAKATGASETAASARLRDLRRDGYEVDVSTRNRQRFYSVSLHPKELA
jgi:biotin operon repressor